MGLESVFIKAADTAFRIFKDAVRVGQYYSYIDTGFEEDNANGNSDYPITIIEAEFSENDIKYLSFSEYIQPHDVKGLVRGKEIVTKVHAQTDKISITQKDGSILTYTVVDFSTDPMKILYTFLLRKT